LHSIKYRVIFGHLLSDSDRCFSGVLAVTSERNKIIRFGRLPTLVAVHCVLILFHCLFRRRSEYLSYINLQSTTEPDYCITLNHTSIQTLSEWRLEKDQNVASNLFCWTTLMRKRNSNNNHRLALPSISAVALFWTMTTMMTK
jgi:hypothetical protein